MIVSVTIVQQDTQWVVLEGSIDGCPQATQRRSITAASLAAGTVLLADEKATLIADVTAAYNNWQAVQAALSQL